MTNITERNGKFTYQIDMLKLELAFFRELERDSVEYGGIGLDSKRPFGNSSVEEDILEIIGVAPDENYDFTQSQKDYANFLYDNLIGWLQKRHVEQVENLLELLREPT